MSNFLQDPSSPVQLSTPVRFSDPMPEVADVVVIGGGVIGMFAALFMARKGLKVVVCEKGRIAGEQSSRNWGWIRQHGRDRAELPIMMEATRLWEEVDSELGGATGFRREGVCYLASSEEKLKSRENWLEIARDHQLDTRMLSRSELDALIDRSGSNGNAHQWLGASYTASDARAEPWQAVPARGGKTAVAVPGVADSRRPYLGAELHHLAGVWLLLLFPAPGPARATPQHPAGLADGAGFRRGRPPA